MSGDRLTLPAKTMPSSVNLDQAAADAPAAGGADQGSSAEQPERARKPEEQRKRVYVRTDHYRLKAAVYEALRRGMQLTNLRTKQGRALARWRDSVIADLGGRGALSAQQVTLVEIAARDKLLLDSVDYWIMRAPALVNRRKRALFPIIIQRSQIADALTRRLLALGLQKKERPAPSVDDYLGGAEAADQAVEGEDA